jgi:N-acetylneuraminic acid mutarotase
MSSKQHVCKKCFETSFASRNQLFAHLKICLVNRNPNNTVRVTDVDFLKNQNAYLYVTGGRIRGKTLACVERYSFQSKQWESMPNMRENRGSHGSASVGEYLFIVGGGGFRSNLSSTELLNCISGEWKELARMPTSRHALYAISVEKSVYVIGGWINGSISSTDMECYNIDSNTWAICQPMPTGRRLLGATEYNNSIYVVGGVTTDREWNCNAMEIYDISTNVWRKGPNLPIAGQSSAATIAEFIYIVMHGHYILRYCPRTTTYQQVSFDLPHPRWFCFDIAVLNDSLYIVGGNLEGVWSNVLWKYDVFTNEWEQLLSMSKERRRCSAAVVLIDK